MGSIFLTFLVEVKIFLYFNMQYKKHNPYIDKIMPHNIMWCNRNIPKKVYSIIN